MRYKKFIILFLIGAFIFINGGCGGGTLGETGIATYSDPPDILLDNAWYVYNKGNYKSARSKFEELIKDKNLTAKQLADAYTGLGFAVAKEEGVLEALKYFEKGQDYNNDAKVGIAAYYLSLADSRQFYKGILALEKTGIQSVSKTYKPDFNKELTTEKVRTLLGLLYYYSGKYSEAYTQFRLAKEINEPKPDESVKSVTDSFIYY